MSIKALNWAYRQSCGLNSTSKFVLTALADYANEDNCAYPSQETLSSRTLLDPKTVTIALERLGRLGFIQDTGERKGRTGRVKVFQLNVLIHPKLDVFNPPENGEIEPLTNPPETGEIKSSSNPTSNPPKNGGTKSPQKRWIEPPVGTIEPKSPLPSPKIGGQLPTTECSDFITDLQEAKRLICERILNGKDPNRLWSVDAYQRLLKHLPIPRAEIERVAWFRTKANDGSPELEGRKLVTETGLMAYWGDEVTRANAYWEKLYGWREKKKAAG